jgi:hypothetical protein
MQQQPQQPQPHGNDESESDDSVVGNGIHHSSHKTTEAQSFLHLLQGYVGPGCLSLPWAVSQ